MTTTQILLSVFTTPRIERKRMLRLLPNNIQCPSQLSPPLNLLTERNFHRSQDRQHQNQVVATPSGAQVLPGAEHLDRKCIKEPTPLQDPKDARALLSLPWDRSCYVAATLPGAHVLPGVKHLHQRCFKKYKPLQKPQGMTAPPPLGLRLPWEIPHPQRKSQGTTGYLLSLEKKIFITPEIISKPVPPGIPPNSHTAREPTPAASTADQETEANTLKETLQTIKEMLQTLTALVQQMIRYQQRILPAEQANGANI